MVSRQAKKGMRGWASFQRGILALISAHGTSATRVAQKRRNLHPTALVLGLRPAHKGPVQILGKQLLRGLP
jgi:hypothetical protein